MSPSPTFDTYSCHRELREVQLDTDANDTDFDRVFDEVQRDWGNTSTLVGTTFFPVM